LSNKYNKQMQYIWSGKKKMVREFGFNSGLGCLVRIMGKGLIYEHTKGRKVMFTTKNTKGVKQKTYVTTPH